jgi:hypothetical protein
MHSAKILIFWKIIKPWRNDSIIIARPPTVARKVG